MVLKPIAHRVGFWRVHPVYFLSWQLGTKNQIQAQVEVGLTGSQLYPSTGTRNLELL